MDPRRDSTPFARSAGQRGFDELCFRTARTGPAGRLDARRSPAGPTTTATAQAHLVARRARRVTSARFSTKLCPMAAPLIGDILPDLLEEIVFLAREQGS